MRQVFASFLFYRPCHWLSASPSWKMCKVKKYRTKNGSRTISFVITYVIKAGGSHFLTRADLFLFNWDYVRPEVVGGCQGAVWWPGDISALWQLKCDT